MARAKRHYIPGQIWHITHRCHRGEYLLKFAKDRQRWLQWLFEAKKRYGLVILNYTVTSNHIHLLVVDDGDRDVIPNAIQLIAGRIGQEFNQRKNRKGAFWEDRYHATAIEEGDHLLQCLVYIDLNMVRAGVVRRPSQWDCCGYNEIQNPGQKNALIDYERLRELLGFDTYDEVKVAHKSRVERCLEKDVYKRDDKWSKSIAVGSKDFIENVHRLMRASAIERKVTKAEGSNKLKENESDYIRHLGVEKCDIGVENTYHWD